MIHNSTIEAVYPLAEKLAKRGIQVTPIETTPVAQLSIAGHYPIPTRGVSELPDIDQRIILGSKTVDAAGVCRHDVTMDEMVEVISQTVRNNLDLARNIINPIVKEVAQDVNEYMQDAESIHRTHVSVIPVGYRSIWNSPVLSEMVARYEETPIKPVRLMLNINVDTDNLLELAKTGASRFDKELEELFDELPENIVQSTFTQVFSIGYENNAQYLEEICNVGTALTHRDRLERVLLTHLFARKLLQETPDGVNMSLEAYKAYMADIVSQTGRLIVGIMRRRETAIQRRQLIAIWPVNRDAIGKTAIEICVNADIYPKWLEEGGEPEAILGSFVSDQEKSYTQLIAAKERYIKEWERQSRVLGTAQRLNRFNHAVDGMRSAIAKQINELGDDQLVVPRELLHKRLEENLSKLYGKFYEDMYVYARMMVCKTIFPHTMGLKILCAIDNVAKDYPDIEIREAALLATIEIVGMWVAKLCKVEHIRVTD